MRKRADAAAVSHRRHGKPRKLLIWLIAILVVALAVGAAGVLVHVEQVHKAQEAAEEARAKEEKERKEWKYYVLERTYNRCLEDTQKNDGTNKDELTLSDGNATLTLKSPNTPLNTYETYKCIAEWTDMPEATQAKIGQTNGFSGMQSDSWDNLEASWSYNGDSGLTLILERK